MEALFHAFYASIPHEWYTNNDIARYEGYYASVFYSYFAGLGLDITVEDSTNHGRLDMAVRFNANVYLFELKVVEMAGERAGPPQEARNQRFTIQSNVLATRKPAKLNRFPAVNS